MCVIASVGPAVTYSGFGTAVSAAHIQGGFGSGT
jgi:hypothetical protein